LFFSLLVITVSFFAGFAMTAQAGRLFHPLAIHQDIAMFFASKSSPSRCTGLDGPLIRGKSRRRQRTRSNDC